MDTNDLRLTGNSSVEIVPSEDGSSTTVRIELTVPHGISSHDQTLRFYELLGNMGLLHAVKQQDYGRTQDPFANVRASEEWGMAPWIGAMVRLNDKVRRLQMFAQRGDLANESAEDSMLDIAVYALIALLLYRDDQVDGTVTP